MVHALLLMALFAGSLVVAYACLKHVFGTQAPTPEPTPLPRPVRTTVQIHRSGLDEDDDPIAAPLPEASASAAPRMH